MRRFLTTGLGVALGLALCVEAQAQPRTHHAGVSQAAAPAGVRVARGAQLGNTVLGAGNGIVVISDRGTLPFNSFAVSTFPVPGLGFDYAHLAAINRNFASSALVDPLTQHTLALNRRLAPVIPVFLPFFSAQPQVIVVQQPPVVIIQQPAVQPEVPDDTPRPAGRARSAEPRENLEPQRPPEPPREVGEFVLVRRDGRVLFAVAFSTSGDRLTYITREGVLRSLPLADLDIEFTRRMNEERGTALRLPS